jgi:hypothetical protein
MEVEVAESRLRIRQEVGDCGTLCEVSEILSCLAAQGQAAQS